MIKGYENLSEENKKLYDEFIAIFLAGWGEKARKQIKPIEIYWCKETSTTVKIECGNLEIGIKYEKVVGQDHEEVYSYLDKEEEYKDEMIDDKIYTREREYLRFDYKRGTDKEWLHVMPNGEFY